MADTLYSFFLTINGYLNGISISKGLFRCIKMHSWRKIIKDWYICCWNGFSWKLTKNGSQQNLVKMTWNMGDLFNTWNTDSLTPLSHVWNPKVGISFVNTFFQSLNDSQKSKESPQFWFSSWVKRNSYSTSGHSNIKIVRG